MAKNSDGCTTSDLNESMVPVTRWCEFVDDRVRRIFPNSCSYVVPESYEVSQRYSSTMFWDEERAKLEDLRKKWLAIRTNADKLCRNELYAEAKSVLDCIDRLIECFDVLLMHCVNPTTGCPPMPEKLWNARKDEMKARELKTLDFLDRCGIEVADMTDADKQVKNKQVEPVEPQQQVSPVVQVQAEPEEQEVLPIDMLEDVASRAPFVHKLMNRLEEIQARMDHLESAGENIGMMKRSMNRIISLIINRTPTGPLTSSTYTMTRIQIGALIRQLLMFEPGFISKWGILPTTLPLNSQSAPRVKKGRSSEMMVTGIHGHAHGSGNSTTRPKRMRKPARSFSPAISPDSGRASDDEEKNNEEQRRVASENRSATKKRNRTSLVPDVGTIKTSSAAYREFLATRQALEATSLVDSAVAQGSSAVASVSPAGFGPTTMAPAMAPASFSANPQVPVAVATPAPAVPSTSLSYPSPVDFGALGQFGGAVSQLPTPAQFSVGPQPTTTNAAATFAQDDSQDNLVLINERIKMETIRLSLLKMMNPDGSFSVDIVPVIMSSIDRAVQSLTESKVMHYMIHKASVDEGVNQLIKGLSTNTVLGLPASSFTPQMDSTANIMPTSTFSQTPSLANMLGYGQPTTSYMNGFTRL